MKDYNIGNTVVFGHYPQTEQAEVKPIEWKILDKKGEKVLLLSKYALDCRQYEKENISNFVWETCFLRAWLNHTFYNSAFDLSEKKQIVPRITPAEKTEKGNEISDNVFLLTIDDAIKYFDMKKNGKGYSSNLAAGCLPTKYAIRQGAETIVVDEECYNHMTNCATLGDTESLAWWIQTPKGCYNARYIIFGGFLDDDEYNDYYWEASVRPAIWINLEP